MTGETGDRSCNEGKTREQFCMDPDRHRPRSTADMDDNDDAVGGMKAGNFRNHIERDQNYELAIRPAEGTELELDSDSGLVIGFN